MTDQPTPDAPTTHVLLVTDRSGSMDALAGDVRGGYNGYVRSLIDDTEVQYKVTSVLFCDQYDVLCQGAAPQHVPMLTDRTYQPGGMTALLDAIGKAITDFEKKVALGKDDRVLLVVNTDGHENSSREYRDPEKIAKMIQDREAGGQWACIFMGAGPDTWRQGGTMGFSSSVSYDHTAAGVASSYHGLTQTSAAYSRGATRSAAAAASGLTVEDDRPELGRQA